MTEQLLQTALDEIQAGHSVMLISVVRSVGSTPRAAGALMLAGETSLLCGTIGGGLLEHRCLEIAAAQPAVPRRETFVLTTGRRAAWAWFAAARARCCLPRWTIPRRLQPRWTRCTGTRPHGCALPLQRQRLVCTDAGLPARPAVIELRGQDVLAVRLADTGGLCARRRACLARADRAAAPAGFPAYCDRRPPGLLLARAVPAC